MEQRGTKITEGKNIHHRVMVCGATGFIGSHLVAQLLKEGYKDVHIISRTINSCRNLERIMRYYGVEEQYESVNIHYGEITNYKWLAESFIDCSTIFNCASVVDMGHTNGAQLIIDNTTLAYLIAEAAVSVGASRIVHVSSIATLSAQSYPTPTTEENFLQTLKGESPYAISKFYSENEMWRIAEKGIDVVIVNPAVVLGYGDLHGESSTRIIKEISNGMPFYTSGRMGYVMVEDVACAMIKLSVSESAVGERFILCGANLCYRDMIKSVGRAMKRNTAFVSVPDWMIKVLAVSVMILNFVGIRTKVTRQVAMNLISKHFYDGTKISSHIDFTYSNWNDALTKMGQAYRGNSRTSSSL